VDSNKLIRDRIVAELLRVEQARQTWNQVYPDQAIPYPAESAISPDPVPVPPRPAILQIRADGACLPRDHVDYVEECLQSDDEWLKKWAEQDGSKRLWCFMHETAKYTGVSEHQAGQILLNCGRAMQMTLGMGRPINPETGLEMSDEMVATLPFAASTFVNNVHHTLIPDARAMLGSNGDHFAGALIKDAAFAIRQIAKRWVASKKPEGTFPTPGFGNGR